MAQILDLAWKFGVTASSDEVAAVGAAFVQLKLVVLHEGAAQPEHIAMEMTLPQLYHFLSEVQKAKAVMDSY